MLISLCLIFSEYVEYLIVLRNAPRIMNNASNIAIPLIIGREDTVDNRNCFQLSITYELSENTRDRYFPKPDCVMLMTIMYIAGMSAKKAMTDIVLYAIDLLCDRVISKFSTRQITDRNILSQASASLFMLVDIR